MNANGTDYLSPGELQQLNAYWRTANYLSVGQIDLMDNPLLTEPLVLQHIKPRQLGHRGTSPGLNLIYAHLNRVIKAGYLNVIYVTGPGHGGPALLANSWLYARLVDRGRRLVLKRAVAGRDPHRLLQRVYAPAWRKIAMARWLRSRPLMPAEQLRCGCDCTWCRCHRDVHGSACDAA